MQELGVKMPLAPQQIDLSTYTEKGINPETSGSEEVRLTGACPMCGGPLIRTEGCIKCAANCGYSECA
jgi:hypothetical protein